MKKLLLSLFLLVSVQGISQPICQLVKVYESDQSFCSAMSRDLQGNIYAAGRCGAGTIVATGDTIANEGMYLTKMNTLGTEIWRLNDIVGMTITPRKILFDNAGNIYVIGNFFGQMNVGTQTFNASSGSNRDFFVAKYSLNGSLIWVKVSSSSNESFAYSAAISNNQILIAGGFYGNVNFNSTTMVSSGNSDIFFIKIDTAGTVLNHVRFGGAGEDYCCSVVSDGTGNYFACGSYSQSFSFGTYPVSSHGNLDGYVLKLNSALSPQWARGGGSNGRDEFRAITLDTYGDIVFTGVNSGNLYFDPGVYTMNSASHSSFIGKYSPAGNFISAKQTMLYGNCTDMKTVGNYIVICGKMKNGQISSDLSMQFNLTSIDGYYAILDSGFNTISIGKFNEQNFYQSDERCFAIIGIDNNSFMVAGYMGNHVNIPDGIYNQNSGIDGGIQFNGGFSFIQKIVIPHMTVSTSDTLIFPSTISQSNPLVYDLNFNGYTSALLNSDVYIGIPPLAGTSYTSSSIGDYSWTSGYQVTVDSISQNLPSSGSDYFLNFDFAGKNLMIRSENILRICSQSNSIVISGQDTICNGENLVLTVPDTFQSYLWSSTQGFTGTTNELQAMPSADGVFYFCVSDANYCIYNSHNLTVLSSPQIFNITYNGTDLSVPSGNSYQWYLDGNPIAGATNSSFHPSGDGAYTVLVSNSNGCGTLADSYVITNTTVIGASENISIFPVPADDKIYISMPQADADIKIKLFNVFGQQIAERIFSNNNRTNSLDVSDFSSGVYYLNIETGITKSTYKVVIAH